MTTYRLGRSEKYSLGDGDSKSGSRIEPVTLPNNTTLINGRQHNHLRHTEYFGIVLLKWENAQFVRQR